MAYEVRVCQVDARVLAAAAGRANLPQLGTRIIELLDQVYAFLKKGTAHQQGLNVVLYPKEPGDAKLPAEGFRVVAGVEVDAPFEGDGTVQCTATPAGMAATAFHMGPYDGVGAAHDAIRDWCRQNGHAQAGPSWEVYGHWSDGPAKVRTDVFYLLR